MNAMTTEQRAYLLNRMNEITLEKIAAKQTELFGEGGPTSPTWGMVFAAIKAGEIVLKEGTEDLTRPYLMPSDVEWPALDAKRKELADYREMLRVERQRIVDDMMLGEAASGLTKFAEL